MISCQDFAEVMKESELKFAFGNFSKSHRSSFVRYDQQGTYRRTRVLFLRTGWRLCSEGLMNLFTQANLCSSLSQGLLGGSTRETFLWQS
ncbi:hypothetical protein K443DRAFT_444329 [Laccaria amethystina LaAM-08-1]|uniref:Uncharacterized protein n=1 Tax=Laccaria amethystina LaAM-08-1 TaxID=1095629 RepID=A0A0C9WUK9_9AGAR|nr:hypothetical protein K443DRAFT_444329 [Laccaria amethystina LaAM-08-1]